MSGARRLYAPRPVTVSAGAGGVPRAVAGTAVEAIREDWLVEDRWWTDRPLRRRYFDLVLAGGRSATVFFDLCAERWYRQRA